MTEDTKLLRRPVANSIRAAAVPLFSILLSACSGPPERGTSSMEMLAPIASPQARTDKTAEASSDIVVNDIPPTWKGELRRPAYPRAALAAHAGECVVNVTITIDTSGNVTEVAPSWQRLNVPGPYYDQFLAAVRDAVRTWRFEPARNVYWRKNGDADLTYMYSEVLQARTDVRFTFEASGKVR